MVASAALLGCLPWIACEDPGIEVHRCDDQTMEFIDHVVDEAAVVEEYVDDALAGNYTGEIPAYATILERLNNLREEDSIRCFRVDEDRCVEQCDTPGRASRARGQIELRPDHPWFAESMGLWSENQGYGALDDVEIEDLVAAADGEAFETLRQRAEGYLTGPAFVVNVCVHETAHLVVDGTLPADHDGSTDPYGDVVSAAGTYAEQGITWERWEPESRWLNDLYQQTHGD